MYVSGLPIDGIQDTTPHLRMEAHGSKAGNSGIERFAVVRGTIYLASSARHGGTGLPSQLGGIIWVSVSLVISNFDLTCS